MKNLCVDFDGVLNTYTGWQGNDELYSPKDGVKEFLQELAANYKICIFSTRNQTLIENWLEKYDLKKYVFKITDKKEPAYAYIDDRGIKFEGDYLKTIKELKNFKTHWEN